MAEMNRIPYVLITPVRNEAATIGETIRSVCRQSLPPREWVIVSDQSVDQTDEIIKEQASKHSFIHFLRLDQRPARSFASAVFVIEAGIAALKTRDYNFIGFLDGDIRLGDSYYEDLIHRFENDPKLGLAGGLAVDRIKGERRRHAQSPTEVAGAVQFFRRQCFESLGGLIALPEGGWDAITCVQARRQGYGTRTFFEIEVDHLKPRNIAEGNIFRRHRQFGTRDYALGYHPLFEVLKCGYRCFKPPLFIGGLMWLAGYTGCYLSRRKRMLPPDIIQFIRREQLRRLRWLHGPEVVPVAPNAPAAPAGHGVTER